MLAATDVLKPPPARIAKLGAGITLPRTVPIRSVTAAVVGAVLSLPFGVVAASFFGIQWVVFFILIFAVAAVTLMEWEPQKGETLLRILGVRIRSRARQQKVSVDGELLSVSIGVARLDRLAGGATHILPGAVEVAPDSVDERGAKRSARNRNLLPGYQSFPPAGGTVPGGPQAESSKDMGDGLSAAPVVMPGPMSKSGRLIMPGRLAGGVTAGDATRSEGATTMAGPSVDETGAQTLRPTGRAAGDEAAPSALGEQTPRRASRLVLPD
jgi:hypothetical protein